MIKFDNVSVVRSGAVFALDSVSFEVETKSRCAVLGANGAGKSTLLWAAMGLLPLAGGAIYFDGTAVKKGNLAAVRKIAALVFQNSDDQLFFPSVLEDVAFGFSNRGFDAQTADARAMELLEKFEMGNLAARRPQTLSDGEKKKAAICSALAAESEFLLLDEPTASLDPRGRREIGELVLTLDKTILVTTHDLDFAARLCERCIVLDSGRLIRAGLTSEILADKSFLRSCGLD